MGETMVERAANRQGNRKVCILGGSGFVGKALTAAFSVQAGSAVVAPGSSALDLLAPRAHERLADTLDKDDVLVAASRTWEPDPDDLFSKNLDMARALSRALALCPVGKVVYFSSLSVYGSRSTDMDITESTPIAPTHPYGAAKFAGECLLDIACRKRGIPLVILRPCKIYGPEDHPHSYGPTSFVHALHRRRPVTMFGDGRERRDHIFVDDVAAVTVALAGEDGSNGVFNLGTGVSLRFRDILRTASRVTGREPDVRRKPRNGPPIDQRLDMSKLQAALPEIRFTGMETGIRIAYEHLQRKKDRLK